MRILLFLLLITNVAFAQRLQVGAYYFDGWSGLTTGHINATLIDKYSEREPIWGWITSTQRAMDSQINCAADNGLSFFTFCWYSNLISPFQDKKNRGLNLYLKSTLKSKLKFNIVVVNNATYIMNNSKWDQNISYWISLFKEPTYLKVNNKPLIFIYNLASLLQGFTTVDSVKLAFNKLRQQAILQGLNGVTIGLCAQPTDSTKAKLCGFDLLTGYNYVSIGFQSNVIENPIDSLINKTPKIWNLFKKSSLPYIPVVTLGWDRRPWEEEYVTPLPYQRYVGYNANSIFKSVTSLRTWVANNPTETVQEKIVLLYAWNEYGEGAWLTPNKGDLSEPLLNGVKNALK